MAEAGGAPYLRVVRGEAGAEEIAALVTAFAVLSAARAGAASRDSHAAARTDWNDTARLLRAPRYRHGGGWRRSAMP